MRYTIPGTSLPAGCREYIEDALGESVLEVMSAHEIRPLTTWTEFEACVALQRDTWGQTYGDVVPGAVLKVALGVGGILLGAYNDDRLVGFVFGLCGLRDGELVHWSHMLAVHPEYRNHGCGRRLKQAQRAAVRAQGIRWIYWTFDPLVSMNAHLNINRLGVEVFEYACDAYGSGTSPLHAGLGTDRLIVRWDVKAPRLEPRRIRPEWLEAPAVSPENVADDAYLAAYDAPVVRIEVPSDIYAVLADSPSAARAWRLSIRRSLEHFLSRGYSVVALHRDEATHHCCYILVAPPTQ